MNVLVFILLYNKYGEWEQLFVMARMPLIYNTLHNTGGLLINILHDNLLL